METIEKGLRILKSVYEGWENEVKPEILFLEKNFSVKIGGQTIRGMIDRIDRAGEDEVEIIDYKTGNPKEKLAYADKRQLLIYQAALEDIFKFKVGRLTYYYLENNSRQSFVATPREVEKVKQEIIEEIAEIKKMNFPPKPGKLCAYCDFKNICEFRSN